MDQSNTVAYGYKERVYHRIWIYLSSIQHKSMTPSCLVDSSQMTSCRLCEPKVMAHMWIYG